MEFLDGTGGCVIFKKQDTFKKYYATHHGHLYGLGLCLAKFLNSPEFSFTDDTKSFQDIIWAFRRFADPDDDGWLHVKDQNEKRTSAKFTYKVDLDAGVVVVARETSAREVPAYRQNFYQAAVNAGKIACERTDVQYILGGSRGNGALYRLFAHDFEEAGEDLVDWVPHKCESVVVDILQRYEDAAYIKKSPPDAETMDAVVKALTAYADLSTQRQKLVECEFVDEYHGSECATVYDLERLSARKFLDWCDVGLNVKNTLKKMAHPRKK